MKVTSAPRLVAEGELYLTCLECGRRWKLDTETFYASFLIATIEERIDELREHDCYPLPRLVTN